ncbi:MAG: YfhO family protein [Anaerolineae bacterium]|nr:YfhO family protein [Anaerolineae bacterium]
MCGDDNVKGYGRQIEHLRYASRQVGKRGGLRYVSALVKTRRWVDGLFLLALLGLALVWVGRAFLPGRVLLPLDIVVQQWAPWQQPNQTVTVHNDMLTDVVNYIYPVKAFMAEKVRGGTLPLWNPYVFTGYPFTYNTQAGLFYPLSLFYYVLPPVTAVDLTITSQLLLGLWFMFLYLRRIRLGRLAALVGAAAFMCNGLMVGWLEWQVVHAAVIWLPLCLYFAERAAQKMEARSPKSEVRSPKSESQPPITHHASRITHYGLPLTDLILLGVAFAMPWLGGHWSWTVYASMTTAVYLLFRLRIPTAGWRWLRRGGPGMGRQLKVAVTAVLLPLSIGLGLSLIQLLPAVHYLSQSNRKALSLAESMSQGLLNRGVVYVMPNFFGNNTHQNWWGPANSNFAETVVYSSILVLLLSGLALWLRRDFYSHFFAAWGGVTLLWALGTPAYLLLYPLPPFNGIQPSRAAFLVGFCLAVLAALAVDRLMEPTLERPRTLWRVSLTLAGLLVGITAVYLFYYRADVLRTWAYLQGQVGWFIFFLAGSLLLLGARLRGWLPPRLFGLLVLGWIVADLYLFSHDYNTIGHTADLYPDTAVTTYLQQENEPYRIATPPVGPAFMPNTNMLLGIANLSGYEPGVLQRISNLVALVEGTNPDHFGRAIMLEAALDSPILDLLNVKYIVTKNDYWAAAPEVGAAQPDVTAWSALPVEQSFTLNQAGLQRLDIAWQRPSDASGTVTARILSANGLYEFAHATLDVADLPEEGWASFYFAPFPSVWGRDFRFRVEAAGENGAVLAGLNQAGEAAFAAHYLPRPGLVYEEGVTRVYSNERYLPRAFVVHEAQIVADEAAALAALAQHQERLVEVVFIELEGQSPPPDLDTAVITPAQATIQTYDLNRVEIAVTTAAPGFLVLADTYYPGWQATVDGVDTAVYRANSLLRAVYVPAGAHTVTFTYYPLDFMVGAVISLLTLSLCLSGLGYAFWQRRTRHEKGSQILADGADKRSAAVNDE